MRWVVDFMYYTPQMNMRQQAFFEDIVNSDDGTTTLSWRARILDVSLDSPAWREPWNSPANQEWGKQDHEVYHIRPSPRLKGYTQIFALTGPGTAFTEYGEGKGRNFLECEPDAILLIDHQNTSIHWMQPGDIELDALLAEKWERGIGSFRSNFPEGFLIGFADGAVWCIRKDVPREAISKFFTVESAKRYDREAVLGPYAIDKLPPIPKEDLDVLSEIRALQQQKGEER
jgi:hypothetical protein